MAVFCLDGKTALVTGSSRGIGQAIAVSMAEAGARTVISGRNVDTCESVARSIREDGGHAMAATADIGDEPSLELLVQQVEREFGTIDILICNAASNSHFGSLLDFNAEAFRKMMDNNVASALTLAKLCVPAMKAQRDGVIILISSLAGLFGFRDLGPYGLSKAADISLVQHLAVELGEHNIRANAIAPGVVKTEFARPMWDDRQRAAPMLAATPLGRLGEPADIAGAVTFLASDAASFITGQTLVIDGGLSASGV